MKISKKTVMVLASLMTFSSVACQAQEMTTPPVEETTMKAEAVETTENKGGAEEWADKAAKVFEVQMSGTPDKRIPLTVAEKARCLAVFPSVVKAGFVVGAKRGDGLITCRDENTGNWGAPAFFSMKGISWGLQIGAQAADVILMFMNQEGVEGLLKAKVSLGGDIGVAAGPIGRNASVSSDLLLQSPIISYARSKGMFAGLDIEGSTITFNKDENEKLYGEAADAATILFTATSVPETLKNFHSTLNAFAPALKEKNKEGSSSAMSDEQTTQE